MSVMAGAVGVMAVAAPADAATSVGDVAGGWTSQMQRIGQFLVEFFFMGGIGLTGYGLWTLYQASKPQSQQTYKSAFTQLGVGGGLCCLPSITGVSIGGIFNGGSGTARLPSSNRRFRGDSARGPAGRVVQAHGCRLSTISMAKPRSEAEHDILGGSALCRAQGAEDIMW
ncbi:hypothetical protein AAC691_17390 [Nguyenibacter vanlangensis]|uniref:Uncharacterized protein n=1 Tax=Nguyenibacter vanlangensis TaxID=1216886 RepID=A0ABZ3D3F9_9PROT